MHANVALMLNVSVIIQLYVIMSVNFEKSIICNDSVTKS